MQKKLTTKSKKTKEVDYLVVGIIGVLVWILISVSYTFFEQQMELNKLKDEKRTIEKQIIKEEKELKKLKTELGKANDLELIEKQAREKLGMIKPDETVYIDIIKKIN